MAKRRHKVMDYPEMDFFLDEELSDVVFVVNGQRIPALKQLLIVKSRVFRAMFSGNFCESKESEESKLPEIVIKDTTFDAFQTLIRFIYTNELRLKDDNDFENICDVYQLSDRYEVLRLRQRVVKHFESIINEKDLISISNVVFNRNIEELMAKVMSFIDSNINELIEWNKKELKELNDSTNDKLLDVLLTCDRLKSNDNFESFVAEKDTKPKKVFVKNEVLFINGVKDVEFFRWDIEKSSFDNLKTVIGFFYFDKLILEDEEDLQLIQDVCWKYFPKTQRKSFLDSIGNHLKNRITVENLQLISGIATTFNIRELNKRVNEFTKENIQ